MLFHEVTKLKPTPCLLMSWFLSSLDKTIRNPNMNIHKVLLAHSHAHWPVSLCLLWLLSATKVSVEKAPDL